MDNYAQTPDGLLLIADGLTPMRVWDGLRAATDPAGNAAPTSACAMAAAPTHGPIVGDYFAYVRFKDFRGNFTDLSPVSAALHATNGGTVAVTNATAEAPIRVTTATPHGMTTGDEALIAGVAGLTQANDTWSVTVLDATNFTLDFSDGTTGGAYGGGGTVTVGTSQITYTGVPVPASAKVTGRQVLRNTAGQATTFYVDVDTADLTATTFTSTRPDSNLAAQVAVPLLFPDGSLSANRHGVPPGHKRAVASHLGRMFAAVEVPYAEGCVQVAGGSNQVSGVGTAWPSSLAGRYLYVVGATRAYQVASVDVANQVLTLAANYADATDPFAAYSVRPAPAERRLVYYSEAGLPESWPATNALSLQEDGDELTGLMVMSSFVYFLERRHVYRFTYQTDPGKDGFVFLSAQRGCVNSRCWAQVEGTAYMLDYAGVHAFSGGADEPVSEQIQHLFYPGFSDSGLLVNWNAQEWFHAAYYPAEDVVRFFVALTGDYLPRHALAYDCRGKRWWVEEYALPVGCSASIIHQGRPRVVFGSEAARCHLLAQGSLDGADPAAGTVRGTVGSATLTSLTDPVASFAAAGLEGVPVVIVSGRGKGQSRPIASATATRLDLRTPWRVLPDATSVYQVGGVAWRFLSKWFRYAASESDTSRAVGMFFHPLRRPSTIVARVFEDYGDEPNAWASTFAADYAGGMGSTAGDTDLTVDATKGNGYAQAALDGHKELDIDGPRTVRLEVSGVTNGEDQTVYELSVNGVEN